MRESQAIYDVLKKDVDVLEGVVGSSMPDQGGWMKIVLERPRTKSFNVELARRFVVLALDRGLH